MTHITIEKAIVEKAIAMFDWLERRSIYQDLEMKETHNALRQAIAEAEAAKQEPVAYDKTEINCFVQDLYDKKMQEGKHGHYETMFHVVHQAIKRATPPQRTEQEPIIDKSAAIRIATALGWTPPKQPAPVQEPCDMGNICAGCSPRNADGSCPHEKENLACDCYENGFNDGMKEMDGMGPYTFPPSPQRKPIQNLQCFHCQDTIETLNDKVMQLMAKRTWVGLTDVEVHSLAFDARHGGIIDFSKAIEAKLKQKNGY